MKNKIKFAALCPLLLSVSAFSEGDSFNGNNFYHGYMALRQEPGYQTENDIEYAGIFAGFVRGVAGMLIVQKKICVDKDNFKFDQAFDTVGNYLKAQPKSRSLPPLVPTIIALGSEFPCPKETKKE